MAATDQTTTTSETTSYPPPTAGNAGNAGRGFTVGAFICAVVAVLFAPIILGPVAMILGYVGHRKGDPLGRWAILAGLLGMIAGFLIAAIVLSGSSSS